MSDAGVRELLKMRQLQDLRLGSAEDESANKNKNTFTEKGFTAVMEALKELPALATLEMRIPSLKKLYISKISETQITRKPEKEVQSSSRTTSRTSPY